MEAVSFPEVSAEDALTGILRAGATRLLGQAIEAEVEAYVARHAELRDAQGCRLVVRNGHKDEREIQTGLGPVKVRQPRVDDRRIDANGQWMRIVSELLPPYYSDTHYLNTYLQPLLLNPRRNTRWLPGSMLERCPAACGWRAGTTVSGSPVLPACAAGQPRIRSTSDPG